jgi:hypothetical protein
MILVNIKYYKRLFYTFFNGNDFVDNGFINGGRNLKFGTIGNASHQFSEDFP